MYKLYKNCSRTEKRPFAWHSRKVASRLDYRVLFTVLFWLFLTTFSSVFANYWFAGKTKNAKSPVMGVLGPKPHCASGNLACLRHRRSIERQDSRWLCPLLKDNQNNFRHSCNFQSAFLRFWTATEKEKRIIISLEVDSILKSPVQTPDNHSRKEYYIEKQWSSLLIKQPWTLEGPPC